MSSTSLKQAKRRLRGQQRLKEALSLLGWKALRVGNTDMGLVIGSSVYCEFIDVLLESAAQKAVKQPESKVTEITDAPVSEEK